MRKVILCPGEDGWWVVECPSLPGCISQGRTREEAIENIKEAIQGYIESLVQDGHPVPEERFEALIFPVGQKNVGWAMPTDSSMLRFIFKEGVIMPIWKLIPIDETSDHWKASTYKGDIIVRASNEDEARATATMKFIIATKRVLHGATILNPWNQTNLVGCQILENTEYKEEGPAAVLYPENV